VIDGEREEVALGVLVTLDGGGERGGVAEADDDGAVRLFGDLAGFEGEGGGTERTFDAEYLHGMLTSSGQQEPAGGVEGRTGRRKPPGQGEPGSLRSRFAGDHLRRPSCQIT